MLLYHLKSFLQVLGINHFNLKQVKVKNLKQLNFKITMFFLQPFHSAIFILLSLILFHEHYLQFPSIFMLIFLCKYLLNIKNIKNLLKFSYILLLLDQNLIFRYNILSLVHLVHRYLYQLLVLIKEPLQIYFLIIKVLINITNLKFF